MAKITLSPITGSYASVVALNNRFQQIEDALNDDVLWRDGFTGEPNAMDVDFDMAGGSILNAVIGDGSIYDAAYLGGLDNTQFVRSDEADTALGPLTVTNGVVANLTGIASGNLPLTGGTMSGEIITRGSFQPRKILYPTTNGGRPNFLIRDYLGTARADVAFDSTTGNVEISRYAASTGTLVGRITIDANGRVVSSATGLGGSDTLTRVDVVEGLIDAEALWLGGHASEPSTRNDGSTALAEGDAYYNNTTNTAYVYNGSGFDSLTASAASNAVDVALADADGEYHGNNVEVAFSEVQAAADYYCSADSPASMDVYYNRGVIINGSTNGTVTTVAGNVTHDAAHATLRRYDKICVDTGTGVVSITKGTESATPSIPTTPEGSECLAWTYINSVADGFTVITDAILVDRRALFNDNVNVLKAELGSTANGEGASTVSIEDSAGIYTGTDVEAALAEIHRKTTETINYSGSVFETTSVPSWATKIELVLDSLSVSVGTYTYLYLELGAGIYGTSGYTGRCARLYASSVADATINTRHILLNDVIGPSVHVFGVVTLRKTTGNTWVIDGKADTAFGMFTSISEKDPGGTLDRLKVHNLTRNFDAGVVKATYYSD